MTVYYIGLFACEVIMNSQGYGSKIIVNMTSFNKCTLAYVHI